MIFRLLLFNTMDFAIYVLGAFVLFSVGLLFFDSWKLNKQKKAPFIRSIGFFLLAAVYAFYASTINVPSLLAIVQIVKVIALLIIFISVVMEPVLHKPANESVALVLPFALLDLNTALVPFSSVLFLGICLWYLWRSTTGFEKQLRPMVIGIFFLAVSEIVKISFFWSDTSNVFWSKILAVHSWIWNAHMVLQFIGFVIIGLWAWGYIRFKLRNQLFITISATIFTVFLVTTFLFSYLLLRNLENDAVSHLKTDARVFQYALDRLQLESLAHARAVAADDSFKEALLANDKTKLYTVTAEPLISQNLSSLLTVSSSGDVLMRAEDRDSIGNNLLDDPLIKSALSGQQLSTLILNSKPVTSDVYIKSAVSVKNNNDEIIGAVQTGFIIDEAFVDGVKDVTGLDATIFAGDTRTATTIVAPDGVSRNVGTLETNKNVLEKVLGQGDTYVGTTDVFNEPYYSAYTPLKAYGGETIGMLFVGRPQIELVDTAQNSINATFLGSIVMMLFGFIPAFLISRYIEEHVQA